MSKKSKILIIVLIIIFIIAIVLTGIRGLNVDLNYAEGVSIIFDLDQQFNTDDVKSIARKVWPDGQIIVQKVEVYNESVLIKVSSVNEEQIESLVTKINEKYSLELTSADISVQYNSNVQIRDIISPYVVPLIIATALIVVYYSIRFRGVKEIVELLVKLIFAEGIVYSIYAITSLPIDVLTMPIVMIVYAGVTIYVTVKNEKGKVSAK